MSESSGQFKQFDGLVTRAGVLTSGCLLSLLLAAGCGRSSAGKGTPRDQYFAVERGEFNVTVVLDGAIDAIQHHKLTYEGRGRHGLEIVEVVEDGSSVEAGDTVVRFSAERYKEEQEKLLLQIEDAEKNVLLAEEDLHITKVGNVNSIKIATDLLASAREAFQKYDEEDAPRKKKGLLGAIEDTEKILVQARRALSEKKNAMNDARMQGESEIALLEAKVEEAEKDIKAAEAAREKAHYDLRVFKRYDHPQRLRALEDSVTKNYFNLQKALVEASSRLVKVERQIKNHQIRLYRLTDELVKLRDDTEKLVIRAPVKGIISLGDPMAQRHHRREPKEIKVGTDMRRGEILGSVPDLSEFMVLVDIPESYRSQVREGLKATLRSKAIPDLVLKGAIKFISPMAVNTLYWDKSSPKIYPSQISTSQTDKRLMPGMTMRVEIIMDSVKDVLFVPVEAVYNREGETFCRVKGLTGLGERKVETGRSSNDYVEILSGLKRGEEVLLHREKRKST